MFSKTKVKATYSNERKTETAMDSSSLIVSIILCTLLLISGNRSIKEGVLKLPCLYEKSGDQWLVDATLPSNQALLVLSSQEDDVESLDFEGVKFIFKDSPVNLMPFLKEDSDDLHCEIKSYFTDNTQILWPGVPNTGNTLDSWYIGRVQHSGGKFHITFFTRLSESPPAEKREDDKRPVLATFMVSTKTPTVYGRLMQNVLLDCTFTVDHQADVSVTWSYQGKGRRDVKLVSYNTSTKKLQYNSKQVLLQMDELHNGNAALLVNNLAMENEGLFTCTISVASLFADQQIRLKIRESPRVTINVDSVTLEEGQEHKFVCDASIYYPLDVNIEWLREDQYSRLLPTLVTHVIYTTHKSYRDGTYSLSGFFLYRASLQDNGITFTCRVEHESLRQPLKKSVRVTVLESTAWNLDVTDCLTKFLILILPIIFAGILLYLVKIYCTARSYNKTKPY